jgi:hypothetical protein
MPITARVIAAAPVARVAPTARFRLLMMALSLLQRWFLVGGLWQLLSSLVLGQPNGTGAPRKQRSAASSEEPDGA